MKKRIALLLVLVMTLALFTGCAAKDTTEPVELIVFTRLQKNVYMELRIWQWRYSLILQRKKICM